MALHALLSEQTADAGQPGRGQDSGRGPGNWAWGRSVRKAERAWYGWA